LQHIFCQNKGFCFVPNIAKINAHKPILVTCHSLGPMNPSTFEYGNLESQVVELSYLLYLTIVWGLLHVVIISINADPTILVDAFLLLMYCVKRVSIDIIGLICHHIEYGACS
jgi:hypothetical protein